MAITNSSKNKITKQNVDAKLITLIDVYHDDVGHFRYTDSEDDVEYNGITWNSYSFSVVRPEITSSGIGNGALAISSVDQKWIARIRDVKAIPGKERFKCRIIGLIQCGSSTELIYDESYLLSDASWNETSLQFTMIYDDKWSIIIPVITCNSLVAYGIS